MDITINSSDKFCEVCKSQDISDVLDLGMHPLCDDLIDVGDNRISDLYPIEIQYCNNCFTAHQKYQVNKTKLFTKAYHYRSRFTADVLDGMKDFVRSCELELGSFHKGFKVLDIGCNDGSLLDFFECRGAMTFGIDPTDAIDDIDINKHVVYKEFFGKSSAKYILDKHGPMDLITFTNVFAHIENLPQLLESLKLLMGPNTMVAIENHYLGSVLEKKQFDTFYHEHPRTYSLTSFYHISKILDLDIVKADFPERYGGNIRVFMTKKLESEVKSLNQFKAKYESVLDEEALFGKRLLELQEKIVFWKETTSKKIEILIKKYGKLSAKAFPARAAILFKLLDLDETKISAVYEKPGSMKIGNYVPGTRVPIKSDEDFWGLEVKPEIIINLAWHISSEIKAYFKKMEYYGEVIDILVPDEIQ